MVGIQAGAISFVDEGTEKVLDVLQERGSLNTIFLAVFTYGRGIPAGEFPPTATPITASRKNFSLNFHGGNLRHAASGVLQTPYSRTRAPDHGNLDVHSHPPREKSAA